MRCAPYHILVHVLYTCGLDEITSSMHHLAVDEHHDIDHDINNTNGYYTSTSTSAMTSSEMYGNEEYDKLLEQEQNIILPMRR